MRRNTVALVMAAIVPLAGCSRETKPDAYGNVEATEITVAAEAAGVVQAMSAVEGQRLAKDAIAATIEVSQLTLEQQQLDTQQGAARARAREAGEQVDVARQQQAAETAQRDVITAQRVIAARAYERTKRLFDQQAATAQQLDQAERDLRTLDEQIQVQTRRMAAQREAVQAAQARAATAQEDIRSASARIAQLGGRIEDTQVRNPIDGTVLTTYVRAGELVQPGQRLYTIADLGTVDVRAYIDETQLALVNTGQSVQVTYDAGAKRTTLPGVITWIASRAEFTPTPIQTREERTGLAYAVKVRVRNEGGVLKIGMPVDVTFPQGAR